MTRLINADKLLWSIPPEEYIARCIVANAPTVDAIPIKWLTAQADNPSNSDKLRNAIDYIVYTLWAERKEE